MKDEECSTDGIGDAQERQAGRDRAAGGCPGRRTGVQMNGGSVRQQPLKPPFARDDENQLKQLVDRLGLCVVLNRLGMICDEKAGHIAASNGDDEVLMTNWARAGWICHRASAKILRGEVAMACKLFISAASAVRVLDRSLLEDANAAFVARLNGRRFTSDRMKPAPRARLSRPASLEGAVSSLGDL
jgi:hypothetical protein